MSAAVERGFGWREGVCLRSLSVGRSEVGEEGAEGGAIGSGGAGGTEPEWQDLSVEVRRREDESTCNLGA
jgi:hypothetical protein